MIQHLQCESLTLVTMVISSPTLVPGAVVLCAEPLVVELPTLEYTIVQQWPNEQPLRLFDFYFLVPDLRGPPSDTLSDRSCRGARSCAPHIIHSLPQGVYAY